MNTPAHPYTKVVSPDAESKTPPTGTVTLHRVGTNQFATQPDAEKLPRIFAWVNAKDDTSCVSVAITADGQFLGHHTSSNESWARLDMGALATDVSANPSPTGEITEGPGLTKHIGYRSVYPDGYVLEWVTDVDSHDAASKAYDSYARNRG